MPSEVARSYNSFSGVDIKAVFGSLPIGEIQAISYSVTREKAPLYTMGSADPRSFSRGKRGIAGTLIFLVFDSHAMLDHFTNPKRVPTKFMSDNDDFKPGAAEATNDSATTTPLTFVTGESVDFNNLIPENNLNPFTNVDSDQEATTPWFADQILPFDVTLAAANEYGAFAVMRIYGVELLNEGYGVSIDDIVSEMQHTYVARTLAGWRPVISGKTESLYTTGG